MEISSAVLVLLLGHCCLSAAFTATDEPNMNGDYILSATPGTDPKGKFPTNYKDYPASDGSPNGVEYFDVYSPNVSSLYSQVFWKGLDPVPLPKHIVDRYAGLGMAIVGFEMDQVRRTPEGDVSVPINVAYNHHFESTMIGGKARLRKVQFQGPEDPRLVELNQMGMGHGIPSQTEHWFVEDLATPNALPSNIAFGGANGGEYRKTFHGYAPGYVQVIESPEQIQITPMQIDTWNRDHMNLTGPTRFVAGPLPRNAASGPDAQYSGLLECPLSTRLQKQIAGNYLSLSSGSCADAIVTASECYAAAVNMFGEGGNTFVNSQGTSPSAPAGCSVKRAADLEIRVFFNKHLQPAQCGAGTDALLGVAKSLVSVSVAVGSVGPVNVSLMGPADVWFGVGWNASSMKEAPWTLIVDGHGNVTERQLADQSSGSLLKSTVTVLESSSSGGLRTVKLSVGSSHFDYASLRELVSMPFINAVGVGPELAYHKAKEPTQLVLLPSSAAAAGVCVCADKALPFGEGKGKLVYVPVKDQPADTGAGTIGFGNDCAYPRSLDLLADKNPTCDVRTYTGGQIACHHMFSLLDADQQIPWVDQPLVYNIKFRFWVQPFNASYHTAVSRSTWGIASPVEYDVPKCAAGIRGCEQQADGNWIHTIRGTYSGHGNLAAAHFHCHAPTCLSVSMYRCGKDVVECNATTGELLCEERPVYGGTGKIDNKDMDEPGFIAVPPCLWGKPEHGLAAPPSVDGYTLHSVKTANATWGHHGEMAWQQMYLV